MRQLVELQKTYASFQKIDTEILAVFREEEQGAEGLALSQKTSAAEFPLLLDPNSKATLRYSVDEFATYVVDRKGIVQGILPGTKVKRPTAKEILAKVAEAFRTPANQ